MARARKPLPRVQAAILCDIGLLHSYKVTRTVHTKTLFELFHVVWGSFM